MVTPHVERILGGFHHRVACLLTGKMGYMGVPPPGVGDKIGWVEGDDCTHNSDRFFGCTIYCDAGGSGSLIGGGATTGS